MVEGRAQRGWSREKEEIPGVTPPGGMDSSPSVSHCGEHGGAGEAGEQERQMLVNPLINST